MVTIAQRLLSLALRVGTWVLSRLLRTGVERLAHYLEGRAEDFERRAARRCNPAVRSWLHQRAQAYTSCAYVCEHSRPTSGDALAALEAARAREAPERAPIEVYRRWKRTPDAEVTAPIDLPPG